MDRWTIQQLNETKDIDFAIAILNERRKKVNPYAPLGEKFARTISTLENLRDDARVKERDSTPESNKSDAPAPSRMYLTNATCTVILNAKTGQKYCLEQYHLLGIVLAHDSEEATALVKEKLPILSDGFWRSDLTKNTNLEVIDVAITDDVPGWYGAVGMSISFFLDGINN